MLEICRKAKKIKSGTLNYGKVFIFSDDRN